MMMLAPPSAEQADDTRKAALAILSKLQPKKAWDACYKLELSRQCPIERRLVVLERGVNFFVLSLEALGCQTFHSCEGHPRGFYVAFRAPSVILAREIAGAGYFSVELAKPADTYSIHLCDASALGGWDHSLRGAAAAWMTKLLP